MNTTYSFDDRLVLRMPRYPLAAAAGDVDLQTLANDPVFMEAIYLASPVLYRECIKWRDGRMSHRKDCDKLTYSLLRYFTRMSSRCTPFGLFSGCGITGWSKGATDVSVNSQQIRRHTRLDMNYLCALAQQLVLLPAIGDQLLFYPNSSAYTMGDEVRYVEYSYSRGKRMHQVSAVHASEPLQMVLQYAGGGATIPGLCSLLLSEDVSEDEAVAFIRELIRAQLLVSEIEPAVTGAEFLHQLVSRLERIAADGNDTVHNTLQTLYQVSSLLQQIDTDGRYDITRYKQVMQLLEGLGVAYDEGLLFQTDAIRPVSGAGVSVAVRQQLQAALEAMNKLRAFQPDPYLELFKKRFRERYEDSEVPLQEALDAEAGIGYLGQNGGDMAPLIDDLTVTGRDKAPQYTWGKTEALLNRKLMDALCGKHTVINLTDEDLKDLPADWNDLPPSFAVMFRIVDEAGQQLYLESAGGSSAACLLGRFAHADAGINGLVCDIARREQESDPDVVYAEIIHLPENRTGNILQRPVFRGYEIPYLAKSSLDREQRIDVGDIYVSVRNNRIVLRSRRLNKEIIPRLSTAHNYSNSVLPVYRFLCDLQLQDKRADLSFNWGGLQLQHCFLPRVTYGATILHPATWTFRRTDIKHLAGLERNALQEALGAFRAQWQLPGCVVLCNGDNELFLDLERPSMVDLWLDTIKNEHSFVLKEFVNGQCPVRDENGSPYVNQFITVLSRTAPSYKHSGDAGFTGNEGKQVRHQFLPGSEWLYYKLYCGIRSADKILLNAIKPLSEEMEKDGVTDKWFFIRYNDPDFHLRIRFHITDLHKTGEVMKRVYEQLQPYAATGYIWKMQLDTYNRELTRYGSHTIELAESFFHYDSIAFNAMLYNTHGDEREHIRWIWALRAVDELLRCFRYSFEEKYALLSHLRDAYGAEYNMDKSLKLQLDYKYRYHKKTIAAALGGEGALQPEELLPLTGILEEKSAAMAGIVDTLRALQQVNKLEVPLPDLIGSYLHMMINRIAISDPRKQEMVIYDLLSRYYRSALVRERECV